MRKIAAVFGLFLLVLVSCSPDPTPKPVSDNYMDIRNTSMWPIQLNIRPSEQSFDGTFIVLYNISDLKVVTQKDIEYLITYRVIDRNGSVFFEDVKQVNTSTQKTSILFRMENKQLICEIRHE